MSISTVTSEALQLKLRQLLPSQQGFGTDLSASDTIIPVIDLTRAAEGSDVPENLQTALSFGSQTTFFVSNAVNTVLINTTGFYRVFGMGGSTALGSLIFNLFDGATSKQFWQLNNAQTQIQFDFIVFLRAGDSLRATATNANCRLDGSTRQIADINGTLVQPVGFNPS